MYVHVASAVSSDSVDCEHACRVAGLVYGNNRCGKPRSLVVNLPEVVGSNLSRG